MTFLTLFEFSKILPSLASSLECLPTLTPHPLTHLTVFPILLPIDSLLSPLNSPSPLAYLSNLSTTLHPFHLSLFHLFPSMQPCVCSLLNLPVPTSTLSCPLPPFLAKLSTLTTLSPFPFPSIHSTLLPIQLSLSYFQVLFTSFQPPFLSYLPSCPPHLISLHSFPPSYLSLLPLLTLSNFPRSSLFATSTLCCITHSQPPLFFFPFHYLTFLSFSSPSPLPTNLAYQ